MVIADPQSLEIFTLLALGSYGPATSPQSN